MTDATSYIYFIQAAGGEIKIGFSHQPYARFAALQTAHSGRLRLLGCIPGSMLDEADLHDRFASSRLRGEWFQPDDALVKFVGAHAVHVPKRPLPMPRADDGRVTREDMIAHLAEALRRDFGDGPDAERSIAAAAGTTTEAVKRWVRGTGAMNGPALVNLMRASDEVFWTVMRLAGREEKLRRLMAIPQDRWDAADRMYRSLVERASRDVASIRAQLEPAHDRDGSSGHP